MSMPNQQLSSDQQVASNSQAQGENNGQQANNPHGIFAVHNGALIAGNGAFGAPGNGAALPAPHTDPHFGANIVLEVAPAPVPGQ